MTGVLTRFDRWFWRVLDRAWDCRVQVVPAELLVIHDPEHYDQSDVELLKVALLRWLFEVARVRGRVPYGLLAPQRYVPLVREAVGDRFKVGAVER